MSDAKPFSDRGWVLSADELVQWVEFLVNNIYIMNGGVIRRQVVGLPMGTNCAPVLANLYLYAYESSFIDRVQRIDGDETARSYHSTFRLIDDILSLDCPSFEQDVKGSAPDGLEGDVVGGIYPEVLVLNKTSTSSSEVQFVGMNIKDSQGILTMAVFDKRRGSRSVLFAIRT